MEPFMVLTPMDSISESVWSGMCMRSFSGTDSVCSVPPNTKKQTLVLFDAFLQPYPPHVTPNLCAAVSMHVPSWWKTTCATWKHCLYCLILTVVIGTIVKTVCVFTVKLNYTDWDKLSYMFPNISRCLYHQNKFPWSLGLWVQVIMGDFPSALGAGILLFNMDIL